MIASLTFLASTSAIILSTNSAINGWAYGGLSHILPFHSLVNPLRAALKYASALTTRWAAALGRIKIDCAKHGSHMFKELLRRVPFVFASSLCTSRIIVPYIQMVR